jgi:hypothetical protein
MTPEEEEEFAAKKAAINEQAELDYYRQLRGCPEPKAKVTT